MDNDAFRSTYRAINERFCPYEKSILTNHCACSLARRFCIAEREGVQCGSGAAQSRCLELLERLRREARFALKTVGADAALPHTKALRLQVGGLRGIQSALMPDAPATTRVEDIRTIIEQAIARFGSLDALPFEGIMQQIAAFRGRGRRRERRRS